MGGSEVHEGGSLFFEHFGGASEQLRRWTGRGRCRVVVSRCPAVGWRCGAWGEGLRPVALWRCGVDCFDLPCSSAV